MHELLANVWLLILGLELALYVILDGSDLGIGILSLFAGDEEERSTLMASVGPVWDANETWLVIAGGTLFGAFPAVYGIAMNALYIPVMVMLFGFIFRAVSLEFRANSDNKKLWGTAFGAGSLIAVLGQGLALGGVLSVVKIADGSFAGGVWDWFNLFSVLFSIGVVFGYTMIGSAYLVMKTSGKIQQKNYFRVMVAGFLSFFMFVFTTAIMPFLHDPIAEKWFSMPDRYYLAVLFLTAVFAFIMMILSALGKKRERDPYMWSIAIFITAFSGLIVGIYPYIVPPEVTVAAAAAPTPTLIFMLFGVGMVIPVILVYNVYVQRVFKGKVTSEDGYEE